MEKPSLTFQRIGMCVSDMDRAVRFYREALAFEEVGSPQILGKALAVAFQVDSDLDVRFISRDGITLELFHFGTAREAGQRHMNQPGLVLLVLGVEDIDEVAARIRQFGGTVLEQTRMQFAAAPYGVDILICADPDGIRIGLEAPLQPTGGNGIGPVSEL